MQFSCLKAILSLLLVTIMTGISAQNTIYTVKSIPNPKAGAGTGFISDPDNIISPTDETIINRTLTELELNSTAQVAVVIVQSIGEANPKDFTYQLFNEWGIGQADVDNGLLILTVMDQRRTEFETGYGLEGVLPDVVCYRIGMQELVPQFREGRYGQGLINAINRVKQTLEDPDAVSEITSNRPINHNPYADGTLVSPWMKAILIYGVIALMLGIYFIARIINILRSREELYDKYLDLRKVQWGVFLFLIPLPYIFIYLFLNKRLKKLREEPRYSRETGEIMRLLSEEEEDDYLERGQITEENIGSADYDVWVTEPGDDILILRYKTRFTKYKHCPKCNYITYYHAHSKTVRHATYSSTGSRQVVYKCKNCNHQKIDYQVIPKKVRSSSSGGSSGGGGFSSGSFGGGSSGGGGAGVSW